MITKENYEEFDYFEAQEVIRKLETKHYKLLEKLSPIDIRIIGDCWCSEQLKDFLNGRHKFYFPPKTKQSGKILTNWLAGTGKLKGKLVTKLRKEGIFAPPKKGRNIKVVDKWYDDKHFSKGFDELDIEVTIIHMLGEALLTKYLKELK